VLRDDTRYKTDDIDLAAQAKSADKAS
jgi:hypothetical protein